MKSLYHLYPEKFCKTKAFVNISVEIGFSRIADISFHTVSIIRPCHMLNYTGNMFQAMSMKATHSNAIFDLIVIGTVLL